MISSRALTVLVCLHEPEMMGNIKDGGVRLHGLCTAQMELRWGGAPFTQGLPIG